jgi:hypothetical protein
MPYPEDLMPSELLWAISNKRGDMAKQVSTATKGSPSISPKTYTELGYRGEFVTPVMAEGEKGGSPLRNAHHDK